VVVRFVDPVDRASVLALVSAGGGGAKELLRVLPPGELPAWGGLAWTPDGQHLLFVRTTSASVQPFELWRVPLEGGTPHHTGIAMEGLRDVRVHPDGQRIAFRAGHNQGEVWVMESFLPAAAR
jgi:dipeptidyl aminopeptidase/acylaminoacyl peptidase